MLGLTFSSESDWGSQIISIAKTASKKIGALIRYMKFFSPEVALHLYKSAIRPCMEYWCQVWVNAPSCYLELLDKLQKRICKTVGPSLAASLEPLAHGQNASSLKVVPATFSQVCSLSLKESTWETRKNVFYFTSKPLFVLEKMKFQNFRYSNFMTSSNA